jgi:hypothetical protein
MSRLQIHIPDPQLRAYGRPDLMTVLDRTDIATDALAVRPSDTAHVRQHASYAQAQNVGQVRYHMPQNAPLAEVHLGYPSNTYEQVFVNPMGKCIPEHFERHMLMHNAHRGCSRQARDEQMFRDMLLHTRVTSLHRR